MEGMPSGKGIEAAGVTYVADGLPGNCSAPSCYSARPLGSGSTITYLVGPQSIEVQGDSSHTFGAADVTTNGSFPFGTYVNFHGTDSGAGDDFGLTLDRPEVNGVPLTYARIGIYAHGASNHATIDFSLFAFGVLAEHLPKQGSATYSTNYNADVYDGGATYVADSTTGSATFDVDFGSGDVTSSIDLNNAQNANTPGSPKSFGVLTGTGTIAAGSPGFDGTFTNPGVSGEFDGAFFGPKAAEMGMAFHADGSGFAVDGVVAGRKN